MQGLELHPEDVRPVLERHFRLPFGRPLDIADFVGNLPALGPDSPVHIRPPEALREGFNPKLVEHQWNRLLGVVREPIQEWRGFGNARAVQVLGQTVLLFMPDGALYSWVWGTSPLRGAHLMRLPMNQVEIQGRLVSDVWLKRLEGLAADEYRCYSRTGPGRVQAMARWQFNVYRVLLSRHADLAWMRVRLRRALGLDEEVARKAESTERALLEGGVLTVDRYNKVWRRMRSSDSKRQYEGRSYESRL